MSMSQLTPLPYLVSFQKSFRVSLREKRNYSGHAVMNEIQDNAEM